MADSFKIDNNISSSNYTITSETFSGTPLTSFTAQTGRILWEDMFVCVTGSTVQPYSSGGSRHDLNFNITYDSSTGKVTLSSYSATNYIWGHGANGATVYYIN